MSDQYGMDGPTPAEDRDATEIAELRKSLATARGALEKIADPDETASSYLPVVLDDSLRENRIAAAALTFSEECENHLKGIARGALASLPHPATSATEGGTKETCKTCEALRKLSDDEYVLATSGTYGEPHVHTCASSPSPANAAKEEGRIGDDPKSYQRCMATECKNVNLGAVVPGWLCPLHYRETVYVSPSPREPVGTVTQEERVKCETCGGTKQINITNYDDGDEAVYKPCPSCSPPPANEVEANWIAQARAWLKEHGHAEYLALSYAKFASTVTAERDAARSELAEVAEQNKGLGEDVLVFRNALAEKERELDSLKARPVVAVEVVEEGAALIAAERARQVSGEHWDASHDDEHDHAELAMAAATYCILSRVEDGTKSCFGPPEDRTGYMELAMKTWPWTSDELKPRGHLRNLVRAGALIAAEIDRLKRLASAALSAPKPGARDTKETT